MENQSPPVGSVPTAPPTWQELAQDLSARTLALHRRDASLRPAYYKVLYAALEPWAQTQISKERLIGAASVTLRQLFERAQQPSHWVEVLVHSFYDPIIKGAGKLNMAGELDEPDLAAMSLMEMKRSIGDIIPNYRTLLQGQKVPEIEAILDFYEEALRPESDHVLHEIAAQSGWPAEKLDAIEAKVTARHYAGLDHLGPLRP